MKKLCCLLAWLFFSVACGTKNEKADMAPDIPGSHADTKKGFDKSKERPVGKPFSFPEGITLVNDTISGYDKWKCACTQNQRECEVGTGYLVQLCLELHNSTGQPISVTFPEGLVFVSLEEELQHGLFITIETVVVPPEGHISFKLLGYCLNAGRSPSLPGAPYILGPVTEDADMIALMGMLRKKKLATIDDQAVAQEAVWDVTKGKPLSAFRLQQITALENK